MNISFGECNRQSYLRIFFYLLSALLLGGLIVAGFFILRVLWFPAPSLIQVLPDESVGYLEVKPYDAASNMLFEQLPFVPLAMQQSIPEISKSMGVIVMADNTLIFGFQPNSLEDVWAQIQSLSALLPSTYSASTPYELTLDDQTFAFVVYQDYAFFAADQSDLELLLDSEVSKFTSPAWWMHRMWLPGSFGRGYIDLSRIQTELKKPYEYLFSFASNESIEFILRKKGEDIFMNVFHSSLIPNQQSFTPAIWVDEHEGILQLSGSDFAKQYELTLSSRQSLHIFKEAFLSEVYQTMDVDVTYELLHTLDAPYVMRVFDTPEKDLEDFALFLLKKTDQEYVDFLHDTFTQFIPTLKPELRNITLPDGTRGQEYIIPTDRSFQREPLYMEGFHCTHSWYEEQLYPWDFVSCIDDTVTVIATSVSAMESLLKDININIQNVSTETTSFSSSFLLTQLSKFGLVPEAFVLDVELMLTVQSDQWWKRVGWQIEIEN